MSLLKGFIATLAATTLTNAAATVRDSKRWARISPLEPYHFVNATTPDATPNGLTGVLFDTDLVPGTTGKDGSTVKKVKVGTYTIPSASTKTFPVPQFAQPCSNCYITGFQLGLEYPDGKVANVDTGAWCHHIDLVVLGQADYTCPSSWLNTLTTFSDPAMGGERIFSAGNERVPYRLNTKSKHGLWLGYGVRFGGVLELMNERAREPITVVMTVTFEYVNGMTPGYKRAQLVWLDVTNCGRESDFDAKTGAYMLASRDFTINANGQFLLGVGHTHDGGTHVEMYHNGQLSCNSKQIYGNRKPGYVEPEDGTIAKVYLMGPNAHITDVGLCKDWGTVKKGDRLSVKAYYDDSKHMQMMNPSGGLDHQMGIMFAYIGWD